MGKTARKQCAANFYAGASEGGIRKMLAGFEPPGLFAPPVAGLVPHAGWAYSGAVAAKVFQTIKSRHEPKTFVIFGTIHRKARPFAVYARGSWPTPFGDVRIDEDLADGLIGLAGAAFERDESAHDGEHSIEVQMPLLKYFFPEAEAVPVSIPPSETAASAGARVGEFLRDSAVDAVIVGTSDLTHYGDQYGFAPRGYGPGALEWMRSNDARIMELAAGMRAERIVPEARANMNACGAGALAATVAAAKAMGSTDGLTIEYATSYDVAAESEFTMAVGYAGMIFLQG